MDLHGEGRVEDDVADVGGVANDGEYDVGLGGQGFGRVGPVGPHGEERFSFGRGAREDGEGVAGLEEVGAHGTAHDAGADPAQLSGRGANGLDGGGGHGAAEEKGVVSGVRE